MKSRGLFFILIFLLFLFTEYKISKYGKGFGLFKPTLPFGIELKNDKQGARFLENGIIHIISKRTVFKNNRTKSIIAYHSTTKDIFVKVITEKNKIFYINISTVSEQNNLVNYNLSEYNDTCKYDWINLSLNNRTFVFWSIIRIISIISFISVNILFLLNC